MARNSYEIDTKATLKDIMKIRHDASTRMTCSPLGKSPGEYGCTVAAAAPWKGKKVEELPARVRAGLENAQRIAAQCKGVKGTQIYKGRVLTARNVCMMTVGKGRVAEVFGRYYPRE